MIVLRLRWSEISGGDEAADDDQQVGGDGEPADVGAGEVKRAFGQHEQRAAQRQIVAVDEADEPEHQDHGRCGRR